jgi:hypothetical protein
MATSRAPKEHYPAAMTTISVAAGIFAPCRCKETNDYSEIGRLNEDEILMPAATGAIPLTRKNQPKPIFWRLLNTNYHEHKHSKPLTGHD